jgi:hypothetical protein
MDFFHVTALKIVQYTQYTVHGLKLFKAKISIGFLQDYAKRKQSTRSIVLYTILHI